MARQHRTALIGCGVLYAVAAVLLAVNGVQMHASYRARGLARCPPQARTLACLAGMDQFNQDYVVWVRLIPLLLLAVQRVAGAFTGAPVLGQDLDRGTFRFAWTQGAGRARLLSAKLVLLGGPLLLAGACGSAALTWWWFSPQYALDNGRLAPQFFVPLGPSFAAWTLLAFALGVAAGLRCAGSFPPLPRRWPPGPGWRWSPASGCATTCTRHRRGSRSASRRLPSRPSRPRWGCRIGSVSSAVRRHAPSS